MTHSQIRTSSEPFTASTTSTTVLSTVAPSLASSGRNGREYSTKIAWRGGLTPTSTTVTPPVTPMV